jgi:methionyl-tRNA formyltransferase
MRVVFMGTPEFAVPTLDALVAAGHDVVLVVAQPDKPSGRGQKLQSPPTIERARALGLPTAQPKALKSGPFPQRLKDLQADVAVVIAYGRILTRELLEAPKHGCVNVHASLLPRWRGAAPIQWAVWAGDAETGVCTQRMEEGLDTGPVYVEKKTPIGPHETAGELHDRLSLLGAECAVETLARLHEIVPKPQDHALATHAGKIEKDMGRVDWAEPAVLLDRRIRAMTPWPGGFVPKDDGPLKLLQVRPAGGTPAATEKGPPGTVLSVSPLVVACGEGALELVRVQAPGRKPVSGSDYANGLRLAPGARI